MHYLVTSSSENDVTTSPSRCFNQYWMPYADYAALYPAYRVFWQREFSAGVWADSHSLLLLLKAGGIPRLSTR